MVDAVSEQARTALTDSATSGFPVFGVQSPVSLLDEEAYIKLGRRVFLRWPSQRSGAASATSAFQPIRIRPTKSSQEEKSDENPQVQHNFQKSRAQLLDSRQERQNLSPADATPGQACHTRTPSGMPRMRNNLVTQVAGTNVDPTGEEMQCGYMSTAKIPPA